MKNLLKLSSTLALLTGFLACAEQTESGGKPLSLYDEILPIEEALQENGSKIQLRFVTTDEPTDGKEIVYKCLTDVSLQPHSQRGVSWNTCATGGSDYDLQVWTMQKVALNTGLRDNVIYRKSADYPGYATYLKIGDVISEKGLEKIKINMTPDLFSRAISLEGNKFGLFNHYDAEILGVDSETGKFFSINTLEHMTYDKKSGASIPSCLSKPSTLDAFFIKYGKEDPSNYVPFVKDNCADIHFEVIPTLSLGAQ